MAEIPAYDLLVLLDPEVPEERRTAVVEQVKRQIDSGEATLKGDADWGMRRLAFEIDHRREAQYHLFQLEATGEVLKELDRSLSIDDSVLRHRIIRLPGEAPEVTPRPPEEAPRRVDDRGERGGRDRRGEREGAAEEPAPEGAAEPAAEAPAEIPPEAAPEATPEPEPEPEAASAPEQPAGETA
jgi:small subunit ribosomal protein S6